MIACNRILISTMMNFILLYLSQSVKILSSNVENNYVLKDLHPIPSPFLSSRRSLPAVKVDSSGNVYTTQILKQQLANELQLPLRDLRIVDPSFPNQIQATFIARPNAILFTLENIKVILKNDEALVFSPTRVEVKEFIPALQQLIAQTFADEEVSPTAFNRFEHVVLEAALNVVCNNLFRKVRSLSPAVTSALNGLRAESRGWDVIQTQVDELLPLKNQLDELRKRVKEIARAITDTLDSDEDMEMMNLSAKKGPEQREDYTGGAPAAEIKPTGDVTEQESQQRRDLDTMNLEMLFENYLNEIGWIASEIEEVLDEITNTEENVDLQLDLLRNRILRFELFLSISSFVIACGAFFTGMFGMNLLSHIENNPYLFWVVSAGLFGGMWLGFISFRRYGKKEQLF